MTNAIILASGLGTRMYPLTKKVPKPLVNVHDLPMIETIICALNEASVNKIFVVVGYLSEQFEYLTSKYSNLYLIKNPDYKIANNISSVYYASDVLCSEDCFICEGDLYIYNKNIFNLFRKESGYFGKMVNGRTEDWVFDVSESGFITRIGKIGCNQYNMVGLSYFTKADSKFLSKVIKKAYLENGNKHLFWDEIVNNNLDKLKLKIHKVAFDEIVEIDTVEELNIINERKI